MGVHPLNECVQRLKAHILTFVPNGILLDINAELSDVMCYADTKLKMVVATNPSLRVCEQISEYAVSKPKIYVLNVDITTYDGIIKLYTFMAGGRVSMVFWRYSKYFKSNSLFDYFCDILNGIMSDEATLHMLTVDKDMCEQYIKSKSIGFNASNNVFFDRGSELVVEQPTHTVYEILTHLTRLFHFSTQKCLHDVAMSHAIDLTPVNYHLAKCHTMVCVTRKVHTPLA
tara:strand:- start:682 stop:1368 length:687 start_codon:yes stop_codon:yes gene_type:complete